MAATCDDCARTRNGPGWNFFNPACIWCGARLVGRLRKLPRRPGEIQARQAKVLEDWASYGHSKDEMLALSHDECPVSPLPPSDSDSQSQTKPRSATKKSSSALPASSSQSSIVR